MRYALHWHFEVISRGSDEDLAEHVQCVMDQLLALESANSSLSDAGVGLDAGTGHVDIDVVVEAPDLDEATRLGHASIRAAVHAAGGFTPGWDQTKGSVEYELLEMQLEPLAAVGARLG